MPDGAAQRRPVLKVKLAAAILKCVDGIGGKKAQKERRAVARRERARQGNVETIIVAVGLAPYLSNERALSFLALCLIHCDGRWVGRAVAQLLRVAAARSEKAGERASEWAPEKKKSW